MHACTLIDHTSNLILVCAHTPTSNKHFQKIHRDPHKLHMPWLFISMMSNLPLAALAVVPVSPAYMLEC